MYKAGGTPEGIAKALGLPLSTVCLVCGLDEAAYDEEASRQPALLGNPIRGDLKREFPQLDPILSNPFTRHSR